MPSLSRRFVSMKSALHTVPGVRALKINLPFVNGPQSPTTDTARATRADKAVDSATATASNSPVALSSTARHLAQLENTDNDVNVVRVDEIRNALAEGSLKINPERIADGLIASAHELIAKK